MVWKRWVGSSVTVTSAAGSAAGLTGQVPGPVIGLNAVAGPPSLAQPASSNATAPCSARATRRVVIIREAGMTSSRAGRVSERRTLSRKIHGLEPHTTGLRRRELLPEGEGMRRRTVGAQPVEPRTRFGDRGPVPDRHPPQRHERVGHTREPFPATPHHLDVRTAI